MAENKYTGTFTCPACSATCSYYSPPPLAISCPGCYTVCTIDEDLEIKNTQKKSIPIEPLSVIKTGANGIYNGKTFLITGCIRNVDTERIYYEWCLLLDKNEFLWLVEDDGTFFIYQNKSVPLTADKVRGKQSGHKVKIRDDNYILLEVSKQLHFNLTGEIPLDSMNDHEYFKYELMSTEKKEFFSVAIFEKTKIEGFAGTEIILKDLKITPINNLKDWSQL